MAQRVKDIVSVRMQVRSLASLSRLRIQHYHKLQCRLQMQLIPTVTVAQAVAAAPIWPLPGNFHMLRYSCKKEKERKKETLKALGSDIAIIFPTFFFCLFRATPAAYGVSQVRGLIGAVATGLCHSHSNTRSLTHWVKPRSEPATSWFLVGFVSTEPRRELLPNF